MERRADEAMRLLDDWEPEAAPPGFSSSVLARAVRGRRALRRNLPGARVAVVLLAGLLCVDVGAGVLLAREWLAGSEKTKGTGVSAKTAGPSKGNIEGFREEYGLEEEGGGW